MQLEQNKIFIAVLVLLFIAIIVTVVVLTTRGTNSKTSGTNAPVTSSSVIGNFEISYTEDSVDFKNYIETATKTWSNIIDDFNIIPITFRVDKTSGNVLAYAWMNDSSDIFAGGTVTLGSGIYNPTGGWANIIEHEIGHVLGIGASSKWRSAIQIDNDGNRTLNRTIFPNSGAAYDALITEGKITGTVGTDIPLSDANDMGVDDGGDHWDEQIFDSELMTPITDNMMPLSSLSIAALKDIGFTVNAQYDEDNNL